MLSLQDTGNYFLYRHPADMRKSFYSLASLVREQMQGEPLSGDIFIFLSRRLESGETASMGDRWFCHLHQTPGRRHL